MPQFPYLGNGSVPWAVCAGPPAAPAQGAGAQGGTAGRCPGRGACTLRPGHRAVSQVGFATAWDERRSQNVGRQNPALIYY